MTTARQEMLSVKEFATECGLSQTTIRDWIRRGDLKAVRLGPKVLRIPASELTAIQSPAAPWAETA